ncbi:GTPase IMAP family member 7-like [Mizuhopecten yessoensis]|uniref:GTPase IMAP family member 7-like n=1 Tax=Mizuhopecten yessoensis TaxID=6573 RepID=UPI000B45C88C|nr:GTPase IMAP family member 7-like [Mizuhopecten yessoensis]
MAKMAELDQDTSYGAGYEYRIALIGRTGSGKSATGNNILGKKVFTSKSSGSSVTQKCHFHTAERFDKKLLVVDTPGLFDTKLSNEVIAKEILKCIGILTPGPHAFILVVQIGRFTPEEKDTVKHFSHIFGKEFFRYLIILFTRRDDLERTGETIQEYVNEVPDELKYILKRCGHKYLAFDNYSSAQKAEFDVLELIGIVQAIINETGKAYFSDDTLEKSELEFQRRAKEIRLKGERKIAQIQEEMEAKQKEMERQRRELEASIALLKEFELQTKDLENSEKDAEIRRKQEAEKKENEAKRREMEIENEKFELRMKLELEEERQRHQEKINNMRHNERTNYENEEKTVMGWAMTAAVTAGKALWGYWFP